MAKTKTTAAEPKKAILPRKLFVRMDDDGDGKAYPVAFAVIEELDDKDEVGIYVMTGTARKSIKHVLE